MNSFLKDFFTRSKSEDKEIRYLKNTFSYLKILKETNGKEVPMYKLELAKILNNMDIFLLKARFILSLGGIFGSIIMIIVVLTNFLFNSYIIMILYIYILLFIFAISLKSFIRGQLDLKLLKSQIE